MPVKHAVSSQAANDGGVPKHHTSRQLRPCIVRLDRGVDDGGESGVSFFDIVRWVSVVSAAVVGGTIVCVLVAFIPIVGEMPDSVAVHIRQRMDVLIDSYQHLLAPLSALCGIFTLFQDQTTWGYIFTAIGVAGAVGVVVISVGIGVPINKELATWSLDAAVPSKFRTMQARWNKVHRIRTVLALLAIGGYTAGALAG
jgi:hypothetical protein